MWAADSNHGSPVRSRSTLRTAALLGGALALTAAAGLLGWSLKPDATASTIPGRRFELPAAVATGELAISRDGRRIAYLSNMRLYLDELQTARSTDLGPVPPVTTGLFFSPDGQRIAYGAQATLRVVSVQGGPPFIVCNVPATGRVAAGLWLDDGTIDFAVRRDSLYRVAATGGTPAVHAAIDASKEIDFQSVDSLPGNRLLVVTHLREQDGTRAEVIDAGVRSPLTGDLDVGSALFVSPNRLVFSRVRTNIGVWTVPFGNGKVDLAKAVLVEPDATSFVVSDEGTLVSSIEAREKRELVWVKPDAGVTPNRIHQLDRDHAWHAVRIALIGCGAVAGWSSRGCYDAGQRRQARTPRPRSHDRNGHAGADAASVAGDADGPGRRRGRQQAVLLYA